MPAKDHHDRVAIARIGGLTRAARYAGDVATAAARQVANHDRWCDEVDPERILPVGERERRAAALRRAHMVRLARLSAAARKKAPS